MRRCTHTKITRHGMADHAACDADIIDNLVIDDPTCRRCLKLKRREAADADARSDLMEQARLLVGLEDEDEMLLHNAEISSHARGAERLLGRRVREAVRP
jgi:hypothetical protein